MRSAFWRPWQVACGGRFGARTAAVDRYEVFREQVQLLARHHLLVTDGTDRLAIVPSNRLEVGRQAMMRAAGPTVTQAANFSVLADAATIGISSTHPTGGSTGIAPCRFVPRAIIAHNIVEVLVVSVVNRPRLSSLCQM